LHEDFSSSKSNNLFVQKTVAPDGATTLFPSDNEDEAAQEH